MPGQFRETRKPVRRPFDYPQPARPSSQRRQKSRQNCGRDFVAPVAKQSGQPDSNCGPVQPGRVRGGASELKRDGLGRKFFGFYGFENPTILTEARSRYACGRLQAREPNILSETT